MPQPPPQRRRRRAPSTNRQADAETCRPRRSAVGLSLTAPGPTSEDASPLRSARGGQMLAGTCLTDPSIADLRKQEFARLDGAGVAYLDYGGAALYAHSQIAAHAARLRHAVLGNPHSENGSSLASTALINRVRNRVLRFFDAGDEYVVCFTANASAAIKLVA